MMRRLLPLALTLLLAGCSAPTQETGTDAPILVKSPGDYSYLNQSNALSRPHMHDYWGGRERITFVDEDWQGRQVLALNGNDSNLVWGAQFLPDDDHVVPQGTASVHVTIQYTPAPEDHMGKLYLEYSTAATTNLSDPIPFEDNQVTLTAQDVDNDLPHQVVSAWRFIILGGGEGGYYTFMGKIHLTAEAIRGRPIPLYPGHPDQWHNASEIPLFDDTRSIYDVWLDPLAGCFIAPLLTYNCPAEHVPVTGALVPQDASYVEVHLKTTRELPNGLELHYHGADTRALRTVQPAESAPSERIYRIAVEGSGDGPYSQRSLWGFLVTGPTTPARTVEGANYELTATAYRYEPKQPAPFSPGLRTAASPPAHDEQDIVMTPNQAYDYTINSPRGDLVVHLAMYNGMSRDLVLDGPGSCDAKGQAITFIGISDNGNPVLTAKCRIRPGQHVLHFDSAGSAFKGVIRIDGATFA